MRHPITRILPALLALSLAACAKEPPELTPVAAPTLDDDAKPLVIDTDMGTDDAMAILYLLGRSDIDIQAIIVDGNGLAHCDKGVENARGLTALAGRPEIPVACGLEANLAGDHIYPDFMRTGADNLGKQNLPENTTDETTTDGLDLLAETIAAADSITVLTLGSLTNLAQALADDPTLIDHIEMVYIMGGAVNVDGNTNIPGAGGNKYSEFNIWVDPTASQIVIASGVPITLVPLDATNKVVINTAFVNTLKADQTTSPAVFTYEMLNANMILVLSGGYYFWDPLAAAVTADESFVTIEDMTIEVVTEGDQIGQTRESDDGYPVRVATDADAETFIDHFLDVLNGRFETED